MGHRMSSLPIARFCSKAPALDTGAGRAAAMSTAWHARCAGLPGSAALLARLSSEEAEEVLGWEKPTNELVHGGSVPLRYEDAEHELEVSLLKNGEVVSVGHLDMGWVVTFPDGMKVAYVGDLKKSEWGYPDGPYSLQLAAYGFAYAELRGCDAFCPGIWAGEEARWTWGDIIDLESDRAFELWEKVVAAALHDSGEFSRGPHCRGCWSRFQCPAHILPPEAATGTLAIMGGGVEITGQKVAQLVLDISRAEDTIKKAKEFARDWEARNPGQVRAGEKVWTATKVSGREGLDKEALLAAYPDAKRFWKRGPDGTANKWVNAK